jgi:hypothetical protein
VAVSVARRFARTTAEFRAATAYWAAMARDVRTGDRTDFDVDLGRYDMATGAFQAGAISLGMGSCGVHGFVGTWA